MTKQHRSRKVGSIANELLKKSREAALAAVQVFNNPAITFKSEIFVVMMVISWTYLLHAHYRKHGVDYRYYEKVGSRKRYDKTKKGAFKHWELERCLNDKHSPVSSAASQNLRFLIGLRHEIEHQMTSRLDEQLSARFQACCLNYNELIKQLFGADYGIDKHLSFSLQFSSISTDQVDELIDREDLPVHIQSYINDFDSKLSNAEFNDPQFAYRVFFVPKTANRIGQADKVIEFIKADSPLAEGVNKQYALVKETEKTKYLPKQIIAKMKEAGFPGFKMQQHTDLWKLHDAKNPTKNFGIHVVNTWYWYDTWVSFVLKHCKDAGETYKNS